MPVQSRPAAVLAALATVARPGLNVVGTRALNSTGTSFDVVSVVDGTGARWIVRAPRHDAAGATLEGEVALLEGLAEAVEGGLLPFEVPQPQGFAPLPEGGRAVIYPELVGSALPIASLSSNSVLLQAVAETIAAIHNLPHAVVANADLPVYDADGYRQRRLAEVDEAAGTGHLPRGLLHRWEEALEDVNLWRFAPTCVHGDLAADHVIVDGDQVVGIVDWSAARVADPADDLAWLLPQLPAPQADDLIEHYRRGRGNNLDDGLLARTRLAGELAMARWLMHGVRMRSNDLIEDAIAMLDELAATLDQVPPIAHVGPPSLPPASGSAGEHAHRGRPLPNPDDSPTTELPVHQR
ncbi:MAG: phosphotransferase [Beutenbergiaceae bacterium]